MKSKMVKTKTSYVKPRAKKFNLIINFDVNVKDKEEIMQIVASLTKTVAKKHNSNVGFYYTEMG